MVKYHTHIIHMKEENKRIYSNEQYSYLASQTQAIIRKKTIRGDLMKAKNPIGIKIIGWFQILGALAVVFTLNVQQNPPFNIRFAVPFIPELLEKIFIVVFTIIITYGYLRQIKWGYWSMLIYSILFCCVSLFQTINYGSQPFVGNAIYSAIVTIYTVLHVKYFTQPITLSE